MSTYALIVGIEKYEFSKQWDVVGPCTNALAITKWLLSIGTPPVNLTLFLSPAQNLGQDIKHLKDNGVRVHCPAECHAIEKHCRGNLKKDNLGNDCDRHARLLVYWSGHGCTSRQGNRIFFCGDYTAEQTQNVLNASNLLRGLLSYKYECFSEQVVLADVCGNRSDLEFREVNDDPGLLREAYRQYTFFATPEGQYAYGSQGRGVFTDTVLEVLGQYGWPTNEGFAAAFERALNRVGQPPYRICYELGAGMVERLAGSVPENEGNEFFNAVYELLSGTDLPDRIFRPHYRRTVDNLGNPELAKAQGLIGMIKELSLLQDAPRTRRLPYGLLQFLVRLAQEESLEQPINAWLKANAGAQKNEQANIREMLQHESEQKVLVVTVEHDRNNAKSNEVTKYEASLRQSDMSPVDGVRLPGRAVKDWDEFKQGIQELIYTLRTTYLLEGFHIYFVVDPPLFDRPFHLIPVPPGDNPLGNDFVVLIRHLERNRSRDPNWRRFWQEHADVIGACRPGSIRLLRIDAGNVAVPSDKGLWFAGFVLPPVYEGCLDCKTEKVRLKTLLRMGVPYLYWLHHLPEGADQATIKKVLKTMLKRLRTLHEIPLELLQERIRGNEYAVEASLLWDDPPERCPFYLTHGVPFQ